MKFEPQCKTVADLHREWARVLEMCESREFKNTHSCVKHLGYAWDMFNMPVAPSFSESPKNYEFAIAIVEGKPVFRGDALYIEGHLKSAIIGKTKSILTGEDLLVCDANYGGYSIPRLSWNPPKPKTFTLENIPAPSTYWHTERCANEFSIHFAFNTPEEATAMEKIVLGQLSKQM